MSVKEVTVKVRVCDNPKCNKEIKGKLKTWVCPGCGEEFCYSCWTKANKPVEKAKKPRKKKEAAAIVGDGGILIFREKVYSGQPTRQALVDAMRRSLEKENAPTFTDEEQVYIEDYLAGGK